MKKLTLLFSLAGSALFLISCGGDEKELFSETITTTDNLNIEMTWTVNGETDGNTYIDIDFVVDDLEQGSGVDAYETSSGSGLGFEAASMNIEFADGTYHLAPFIYEFEVADEEITNTNNIVLTFTIYPGEDEASAITFTQKFTHENYHQTEAVGFAKFTITKAGDEYTIEELNKVLEINSGWSEGE